MGKAKSLWFRLLCVAVFVISANLLAGYLAVVFNYPSLFNAKVSFWEYAVPMPFTWALAHIPSLCIFSIPLFMLHAWQEKSVRYFRIFCGMVFLVSVLELDNKVPFLLFLKVDSLVAFIFSLMLAPPNKKDNPGLVVFIKGTAVLVLLLLATSGYINWTHRTPSIANTQYVDDVFELKSIIVNSDHRKSMNFLVRLTVELPAEQACAAGQRLATALLRDYPFDDNYDKRVMVSFNVARPGAGLKLREIGEISLNEQDKQADGRYACYIKPIDR